mmetsp:Transcript_41484/g.68285  ORF Transcript_41484/g.68285 Transcript_41484/m.68285 type:complete len:232 (+) Transcript_41484:140-835(+)
MKTFVGFCLAVSLVSVNALSVINAHHVGNGGGYSHYRVCENQPAVFSCDADGLLKVGGCWYGSPNSDIGEEKCPHDAVGGDCAENGGVCMDAIRGLCENRPGCTVPVSNVFMMGPHGDPCPGTYKYAAIALRCECPWYAVWCSVLQLGRSEPISMIGDSGDEEVQSETQQDGVVPFPYMIGVVALVMLLLLVNLACWIYQCCSAKCACGKKVSYEVVSQVVSSDEEQQPLH